MPPFVIASAMAFVSPQVALLGPLNLLVLFVVYSCMFRCADVDAADRLVQRCECGCKCCDACCLAVAPALHLDQPPSLHCLITALASSSALQRALDGDAGHARSLDRVAVAHGHRVHAVAHRSHILRRLGVRCATGCAGPACPAAHCAGADHLVRLVAGLWMWEETVGQGVVDGAVAGACAWHACHPRQNGL